MRYFCVQTVTRCPSWGEPTPRTSMVWSTTASVGSKMAGSTSPQDSPSPPCITSCNTTQVCTESETRFPHLNTQTLKELKCKMISFHRVCRRTVQSTHSTLLHPGFEWPRGGQACAHSYQEADHQLEGHQQVQQTLYLFLLMRTSTRCHSWCGGLWKPLLLPGSNNR